MRFAVILLVMSAYAATVQADTFPTTMGDIEIEFVTIGDPGNPDDEPGRLSDPIGDPNPVGAVDYTYRIGKYEISESMVDHAAAALGRPLPHVVRGPELPVTGITWNDAAWFVNWLNTSTGHAPAYKDTGRSGFQVWEATDPGYDPANPYRNTQAFYFLPSVDEWYKAAYYDPTSGEYYDYATGSDTQPDGIDFAGDPDFEAVFSDGYSVQQPNAVTNAGVLSPYGTMGQTGNVAEWDETAEDLVNDSAAENRGSRGGIWSDHGEAWLTSTRRSSAPPVSTAYWLGFRVASRVPVPEPGSVALGVWAAAALLGVRRSGRAIA